MPKSLFRVLGAVGFLVSLVSFGSVHAMPTNGNDSILFSGTLGPVNTTLISPSGHSIAVNGTFNVNNTTYDGLGGNDALFFTNFDDFLQAGVVQNVETFILGDGDDILDASLSNVGASHLGGRGNDIMFGTPFADFLRGDADDDFIDGGAGDDVVRMDAGSGTGVGGTGSDTYILGNTFGDSGLDFVTFFEIGGSSEDVIVLPSNIEIDDLVFSFTGDDLRVDFDDDDGRAGGFLIVDQYRDSQLRIDEFQFQDNSVFDLTTLRSPNAGTPIPEPGTLALFGFGLGGLLLARMRKTA